MGVSSVENQANTSQHTNIGLAETNRAQGTLSQSVNSQGQSQVQAEIEADPAQEAQRHQHKLASSKDDLDLPKTTGAALHTQSKDDSHIARNPTIGALQSAGVDIKNYTDTLLDSPQLFEALKVRGLLLLNESSGSTQKEIHAKKSEVQTLVDDLNNKLQENKPLVPSTNLNNAAQLAVKMDKLGEVIKNQGQQSIGSELQADSKKINQTDLTDKEKVAQTVELLNKNIALLQDSPNATPLIQNTAKVLELLVGHLESEQAPIETEKKQESDFNESNRLVRSQSQGANTPKDEQPELRKTASSIESKYSQTNTLENTGSERNLSRSQSQGENVPKNEQAVLRKTASSIETKYSQTKATEKSEPEASFVRSQSQGANTQKNEQASLRKAASEGGQAPTANNKENKASETVSAPQAKETEAVRTKAAISPTKSLDDSNLPNKADDVVKQVNTKALEAAGLDPKNYSQDLLESPQLFNALKTNDLLFIEEDKKAQDKAKKELEGKQEKVDSMIESFALAKPMSSKVNLDDVPKLQKMIQVIGKELQNRGANNLGTQLAEKSAAVTANKSINYETKVKQLAELLNETAEQLKTQNLPTGLKAKGLADGVKNLAELLSLQQESDQAKEAIDTKKQQAKNLVNDLNKKAVQGEALVPNADMNNISQLKEKMGRLADVIEQRGAQNIAENLRQKTSDITNDASLKDKEKTSKIGDLVKETATKLQSTPARDIATTIQQFADQIKGADTQDTVKDKKNIVDEDLAFLDPAGSKRSQKKTLAGIFKQKETLAAVRVTAERGHEVARKGDGKVDMASQTGAGIGGFFGIKGDSLTGKKDTTVAGVEVGGAYNRKHTRSYKNNDEVLQQIAENPKQAKKNIASGIVNRAQSILSRTKNDMDGGIRTHMNDLHQAANKQNAVRNRTEQLSNDLQRLGVLNEGETLRLPDGQSANLTKEKFSHTGALKGSAAMGRNFIPGMGASGSVAGEVKVDISKSYEPKLEHLLKNDEARAKAIEKYKLDDIATLNKELEGLSLNNADNLNRKAQILEEVKEKIIANLSVMDDYETAIRAKDTQGKGSLQQRLMDRLSTSDKPQTAHQQIEQQQGTKGRSQTLDKLQVQHAALVKIYNDLTEAAELTQVNGKDNSESKNKVRLPGLTSDTLDSADNKRRLDQLGIDTSKNKERLETREREAFDTMLEQVNKDLHKPNITLSDKAKKALHVAKQDHTQDLTGKFSASTNFGGSGVSIEGSYTKPIFAKPGETESSMAFTLAGEGVFGAPLARGVRDRIAEDSGQDISDETWHELTDILAASDIKRASLASGTGAKASASVNVEIKDGRISAIKLNTQTTQSAGVRIPIGLPRLDFGAVELGAEQSQTTPQKVIMGSNSLANVKERFSEMNNNNKGHIDIDSVKKGETSKKDDWNVMVEENKTQLMKIAQRFADPDSGPIKDLNKVIDELHFPALHDVNATETDKKQTYYDAYGTDGPDVSIDNGSEIAEQAGIELENKLDQRIKEIMIAIKEFANLTPEKTVNMDKQLENVKTELSIFDKVENKSPELEAALKKVNSNLDDLSKTSDSEEVSKKLGEIQDTLDSLKDIFSAKKQLTAKRDTLVEKSKELNALTSPQERDAKFTEIMDELKAFYVLEKDKVSKPSLDSL